TPHHLKYADAHSGTTLLRPARAKARTSSKASQGFFSRFRRSIFWAFVSFTGTASAIIPLFRARNTKPAAVELGCYAGVRKSWFLKSDSQTHVTAAPNGAYSSDNRPSHPCVYDSHGRIETQLFCR